MIVRKFRIDMYTLLYLKWITNKDLLYSTENSAQWAAWMWGFRGRIDTCICTAESFCSSPEAITRLLIVYTPIQNSLKKKVPVNWLFLDFGVRVTELSRT